MCRPNGACAFRTGRRTGVQGDRVLALVPAQAPHRRKQRARHGLAPKGGVHGPAPAIRGHAIRKSPARLRARPECLAPGPKGPGARAGPAPAIRGHAIRKSPARLRARPECLAPGPKGPGARAGTAPAIRGHAIRKSPARLRARPECLAPGPKGPGARAGTAPAFPKPRTRSPWTGVPPELWRTVRSGRLPRQCRRPSDHD